ncbi:hypothetical protein GGS26DRAFT_595708 [Hypomontagnella submonticulosa]|nr:hypothetical protein GGS26DRAFT_595708 [Hypomontagnella submonticulosa]
MQSKNLLLVLAYTVGLSNAHCTLQAFSGDDCNGPSGLVKVLDRQGYCIDVEGRRSYRLHDCDFVHIERYFGANCGGHNRFGVDYENGCHSHNPARQSLFARTK